MNVQPLADRPSVPFFLLIGAMIVTPWVSVALGALASGLGLELWINFIVQVFYWAILLLGMQRRFRQLGVNWNTLLSSRSIGSVLARGVGLSVGLIAVHFALSSLMVWVSTNLIGKELTGNLIQRERMSVLRLLDPDRSPIEIVVLLSMAIIAAPIIEELFFRGYVYPVFKHVTARHAPWMSGLLFAVVHFYWLNLISVFVLGWLLALAYERTGDIRIPIIAHVSVNSLVALVAFLVR